MKQTVLILLLASLMTLLSAQILDELKKDEPNVVNNEIVKVNYNKKSAAKAMLFSSLFPGSGQYYVNKKSITAYIFPVIEIGLWVGYASYYNKGLNEESDYEKYANAHYDRVRQNEKQAILNQMNPSFYTIPDDASGPGNAFFRLDVENTQHFYEDIGKYDKYVFGWDDWDARYKDPTDGSIEWAGTGTVGTENWRWLGNVPGGNPGSYDKPSTPNRSVYIKMRKHAEDRYRTARNFGSLVLVNHMLASIDALRIARKHNQGYLSTSSITPEVKTTMFDHQITPMFSLTKRF